ncbi:MAG: winged helix-turn-helix domain-containing protein [Pseudomonadota bacterium]
MSTILIIDDEPQIRRFLRIGLTAQHYEVVEAATAKEGLAQAVLCSPRLIILDLGLPDQDGQETLQRLREFYVGPLIVLSVRDREVEKVKALDSGANDYVVKPFGIQELLARIRALLRQQSDADVIPESFDDGTLRVDMELRKVTFEGKALRLSKKEFALLTLLISYRGRVVTQRQLLTEVWGKSHVEDAHYLRILIARLRAKLEDDPGAPRYLETEPGVGYRFLGEQ